MRKAFLLILILLFSESVFSQPLSLEETKLYEILMQYRAEKGLTKIPLSSSLTFVAQTHAKDLVINKPDNDICNAHSWSSKGNWTPVCYTPDHAQAKLMWSKPKELTSYKADGFEIACGSNVCCTDFVMTAEYALKSWKMSKGHNAVIVNEGPWSTLNWKAIGIGIQNGFAVVWFGEELDNK